MALEDPQSIAIAGQTTSLPRVFAEGASSNYQSNDGLIVMKFAHSYGKRVRHTARVDHSKITADPFLPSTNVKVGMSVYVVWDLPLAGYTVTDAKNIWEGLGTNLNATVGGDASHVVKKVLGGES